MDRECGDCSIFVHGVFPDCLFVSLAVVRVSLQPNNVRSRAANASRHRTESFGKIQGFPC